MTPSKDLNGIAIAAKWPEKSNIKRQLIAQTDSPSFCELVTITISCEGRELSFGQVKAALEMLNYIAGNDIRIEMNYRDYDCTGQQFTTSLDQLKRFTVYTGDGETLLIGIYEHWVSIDC